MRRFRGRQMSGQNMLLAAGLVVLGVVVVMTLNRFMTRDDGANRQSSQVYLTDERTVVGSHQSTVPVAASSAGSEDESATRGNSASASQRRNRPFSYSSGSKLFASSSSTKADAVNQDMRDMISSSKVLVRLFGTADGDFIYHQTYGWMQFKDGAWSVLDPFDLPDNLHELFPQLCQYPAASGGGGGDAAFNRDDWTANPQGQEDVL